MSILLDNKDIILHDKFNIISNDISKISKSDLTDLLDNYFENLLVSDDKIFSSDIFSQILWFQKDFDPCDIIIKHLDNYLKQKKLSIKKSIKNGNFDIHNNLNMLIEKYYETIKLFTSYISDKEKLMKLALAKIDNQIISDPIVIQFLKSELSQLDDSNQKDIIKLTNLLKQISNINPDIGSYKWFLTLVSSSLLTLITEIEHNTYPVPKKFQEIINLRKCLSFYEQVEKYYSFVDKNNINIIFNKISNEIVNNLANVMDICSAKELISLIHNYKDILQKIFNNSTDSKKLKEKFTSHFFIFLEKLYKNKQKIILDDLINCFKEVNTLLSSNSSSRELIDNTLSSIFSNEESQNLILDNINQSILNDNVNDSIYNVLTMCSNIKEKDKFIDKYNRLLINRLLHKPNVEIETKFINSLKSKFNEKLLFKTNQIIFDMEYNIEVNTNFKEYIETGFNMTFLSNAGYNLQNIRSNLAKLNTIVSSYSNWDVNQQEGVLLYDTIKKYKNQYQLLDTLYTYDNFYRNSYDNKRKLIWYPHFGEIKFTYLNKDIVMLPIQFMILEHINLVKTISKEDILKNDLLNGYNDKFKNSIITSLIIGGIIVNNQNILSVETNIDKVSSDFIKVFFNSSNYANVWEEKRKEELIMNRKDVLSACINHFVKKGNLTVDELFGKIKETMNLFSFSVDDLVEVINTMISKDYIKKEGDLVEKLMWC